MVRITSNCKCTKLMKLPSPAKEQIEIPCLGERAFQKLPAIQFCHTHMLADTPGNFWAPIESYFNNQGVPCWDHFICKTYT